MLRRILSPIMYGIVLISYLLHIYIYVSELSSYGIYIIHVLSFFSLVIIERLLKKDISLSVLSIVQILYATWICQSYGGLTNIAALAPIFIYYILPHRNKRLITLTFHLIMLNIAIHTQDLAWIAVTNLIFILLARFLHILQEFADKRHQEQYLFDDIRKKNYELNETRNRLLLFTQQVEGNAQAEERSRISQQLHDDVGHRLIRAKMMMEAVIHIFPKDYNKGIVMLYQIRDQLASGLEEMRATVKRLKPSMNHSGIESIQLMMEEVGRETGIKTDLIMEGNPSPLYPSQELILYKNALEAVTNALKHGNPHTVTIIITYMNEEVVMAVSNDGDIPDRDIEHCPGQGLIGMKERCAFAGGRLVVNNSYPFTITTIIPINRDQERFNSEG